MKNTIYIIGVVYKTKNGIKVIDKCLCRGEDKRKLFTFTKKRIIEFIKTGNTDFITEINGNKGEEVEVYTKGVEEFIRTNPNEKITDNLGELPEIDPSKYLSQG